MLFNSVVYWLFLPLVWVLYFCLPQRGRWVFLLLSSYVFYGFWKWEFAGLMALTSVLDWALVQAMIKQKRQSFKKIFVALALLTNIGLLFLFKYFDFALGSSELARQMYHSPYTAWIIELGKFTVPAGISFYTFQSISYVIDVYKGQEQPEPSLPKFMLFVAFFPQLVAGPIERFGRLHQQLFAAYQPRWAELRDGFRLLLYGLFLKVAVADNLASVVDQFYAQPNHFDQGSAWVASFFFTFQVYTDFFGYSLLAQGSALLFGIRLMDNFQKPFLAKSIPEFWHRWHISLSTWFRDYLFIPVGGNQRGPWVLALAVLLVFFTSGLWHGANSTMIVFGLAQGVLYLFDRFVFKRLAWESWIWDRVRQVKTGFFFMMTLVYFRSGSMDQAVQVFRGLMGRLSGRRYAAALDQASRVQAQNQGEILLQKLQIDLHIPLFLLVFWILDHAIFKKRFDAWAESKSLLQRWGLYLFFIAAILIWGGAVNHPFVYFQF
ncbi:MAG: MBOAT family O-acyltransferase [Bacteroidia bacterium]